MRDAAAQVVQVTQVSVPPTSSTVFDRRLNDKILTAFSHAYASGEVDLAMRLREVLEVAVSAMLAGAPERRRGCPLERARLWMAFIDARDAYRAVCAGGARSHDDKERAFEAMKTCYQAWCAA